MKSEVGSRTQRSAVILFAPPSKAGCWGPCGLCFTALWPKNAAASMQKKKVTNFNSSWSGFVISFSFPVFFWIVWNCGRILQHLWMQDSKRMQESIEENLSLALKDLARRAGAVESGEMEVDRRESFTRKKGYFSSMKTVFKLASMLFAIREKRQNFFDIEVNEVPCADSAKQDR